MECNGSPPIEGLWRAGAQVGPSGTDGPPAHFARCDLAGWAESSAAYPARTTATIRHVLKDRENDQKPCGSIVSCHLPSLPRPR